MKGCKLKSCPEGRAFGTKARRCGPRLLTLNGEGRNCSFTSIFHLPKPDMTQLCLEVELHRMRLKHRAETCFEITLCTEFFFLSIFGDPSLTLHASWNQAAAGSNNLKDHQLLRAYSRKNISDLLHAVITWIWRCCHRAFVSAWDAQKILSKKKFTSECTSVPIICVFIVRRRWNLQADLRPRLRCVYTG